jgi:hypothetical protein
MQTWIPIDEFAKTVGKDLAEIEVMCEENKLVSKIKNDIRYIEAASATSVLLPAKKETTDVKLQEVSNDTMAFVEKTIGTILNLHEKVLDAKDETVEALKQENQFLKEGLLSMQELYEEDRKTIETLTKQLQVAQEELEFVKRKYKLMWGKAIENAARKNPEKKDED